MQIIDPVPLCNPPDCKKIALIPGSSEFVHLVGQLMSKDLNVQVDLLNSVDDYSLNHKEYYAGMKMFVSNF